ncbi:IclR family transcriptional regulator [Lentibacillus juripiscarius]|uniref:IclR family transcriptional regulator n=1 Tax=Lentibacillus juripiscarius TaxID=257446 RepID=A0ABW5VBX4_9BACI
MIQSIDRAMKIIYTLSSAPNEPWNITDIAEHTELPVSTVYRLIDTLEAHDLITPIPDTKQFKLGFTWIELGMKLFENLSSKEVARPSLEKLAMDVEETVYLNIPAKRDSIIIDRVDSPRKVKVIDSIGERIPFNIGAANKAILANMDRQKVIPVLKDLSTGGKDVEELIKQLNQTKVDGYSTSYGEKTKGTIAVAAPVIGFQNKLHGAISIEFLEYETTEEEIQTMAKKVKQTAHTISQQLGGA